jgi:hypothetical protein
MDADDFPARIGCLPTNIGGLVLTTGDAPTGIVSLPKDIVTFPTTAVSVPADIDCLVLNTDNLPATDVTLPMSPKTSKTAISAHFSI